MEPKTEEIPLVVYHVACMNEWEEIVAEQLDLLKEVGLTTFRLTHVGPSIEVVLSMARSRGLNAILVRSDPNVSHYETFAMLEIERLAKVEQTNRPILYLHTKGVSAPGDIEKRKWRWVMQEHVIRKWRENLDYLKTHHAVGWNWRTDWDQHFPGNFWIASPVWIRELPDFASYHWSPKWNGSRFSCEMWIGSKEWCIAKSMCCHNDCFWNGSYNWDQWLNKRHGVIKGQWDYRGTLMQQHEDTVTVWSDLLKEMAPARIIEIGTGHGGFARFLRDTLDNIGLVSNPIWTVDIQERPQYSLLRSEGVIVRILEPFGKEYRYANSLIEQFVQSPGRTLILCDGPAIPKEFAIASQIAKPGDIIAGHDYAPSPGAFATSIQGKVWNWHEFSDRDAAPSVKQFAMTRWEEEKLQAIAWCAYQRGTEIYLPSRPVDSDVTVVIPTIPVRHQKLIRALESVHRQTLPATKIITQLDISRQGACATRNTGLAKVTTSWVAFLDDDDEFYSTHLEELLAHAKATGADVVYSGCDVCDGSGNILADQEEWGNFGHQFDPVMLRRKSYIPVTCLARTDLAQQVKFSYGPNSKHEDWGFYLGLLEAGAKIVHLPSKTWRWWHWGCGTPTQAGNTSGLPDRW